MNVYSPWKDRASRSLLRPRDVSRRFVAHAVQVQLDGVGSADDARFESAELSARRNSSDKLAMDAWRAAATATWPNHSTAMEERVCPQHGGSIQRRACTGEGHPGRRAPEAFDVICLERYRLGRVYAVRGLQRQGRWSAAGKDVRPAPCTFPPSSAFGETRACKTAGRFPQTDAALRRLWATRMGKMTACY
jgi:hypothetical protein